MKKESFTSASVFPAKVIRKANEFLLPDGRGVRPYHIQLSPTNRCNLACEWCSCAGRDAAEEMPWEKAKIILSTYGMLGAQALTITGGGEPLMYPHIGDLIRFAVLQGMQAGLVTNGYLLKKADFDALRLLRWCRVSCSDDRAMKPLLAAVEMAVTEASLVDWAWSYVLTSRFDEDKLVAAVEFANAHKFSHVRVVSDLLNTHLLPPMSYVQDVLKGRGVDDSLVIYQGRKEWEPGAKRCLISLLKPMIATSGDILPCCGVQYAMEETQLDFDKRMVMGRAEDIHQIYSEQAGFDGSRCVRCYYGDYNRLLSIMLDPLEHEEFV